MYIIGHGVIFTLFNYSNGVSCEPRALAPRMNTAYWMNPTNSASTVEHSPMKRHLQLAVIMENGQLKKWHASNNGISQYRELYCDKEKFSVLWGYSLNTPSILSVSVVATVSNVLGPSPSTCLLNVNYEAQESLYPYARKSRLEQARKTTRIDTLQDQMHYVLTFSDKL